MERVKPILDWATDPANSTVIRTLVVTILSAPAALLSAYLGWRWMRGRDSASLIDATARQNQALHATIVKMDDQIAVIESILHAWRRMQEPVTRIDAAAADLRQRTAETSALARTYLERGDTNAAKALFRDLAELRREAASLFAQSQSIAALLEKRLDYLHRSDAEMSALVRKLMHTRPYRRLLPPPRL
jgi:hypothetical protein